MIIKGRELLAAKSATLFSVAGGVAVVMLSDSRPLRAGTGGVPPSGVRAEAAGTG